MSEEFIIPGFEEGRYLKAVQMRDSLNGLIKSFENQFEEEIQQVGNNFIEARENLFEDTVPDADINRSVPASTEGVLGRYYAKFKIDRLATDYGEEKHLKLNIGIYWLDSTQFSWLDDQGDITMAYYKIKYGNQREHSRITSLTKKQNWEINVAPSDPYPDYAGSFYIPMNSPENWKSDFEKLKTHFEEFGNLYGDNE